MSSGNWDEVFEEVEAEQFVGRHEELANFRQQISFPKPRYLIFYITGQGGVGKTTLLNRYREIAQDNGFLVTVCDEHQRDVPSVLGHFAQQLFNQGLSLKRFNERFKIYQQKMHEIESDPEAPQGLAAGIARTAVRAIFISGDTVPGVRKGLEYISREVVETQASEWVTYLIKKFTNKDEVALMREPTLILAPLFFADLNEITQRQKVLLCFDNFEAASPTLLEWLLRIREFKPSLNIRIIIAGRDEPGTKWDSLRSAMYTVRLDIFTKREAESFLDMYNITNSKRREEILELTGKLPVLMSWLASPGDRTDEAIFSIPTHDIVDRFLRWVEDPTLRQVALLAAIPRTFNADILNILLKDFEQTMDEQSIFDWLQTMPFVKQGQVGWYYHDVVRRMMLQHQRKKSPDSYHYAHVLLAVFFNPSSHERFPSTNEEWANEQWRYNMLAYTYHFLVADIVKHWSEAMSLFVMAMRKRRSFAIEIIELLNLDDVQDELSSEQKNLLQLFKQQLQAIESGSLEDGFEMFDKLCAISGLSAQAKTYALAYRGECYRLNQKWERALGDFGDALSYMIEDAWAIGSRGQTYLLMKRYEEALADLNQAITLDEKLDWAIGSRGQTYQSMGRYEEALADFNSRLTLDEKDDWALAQRGATYLLMGRYEEALADFNQVIALDEKDDWTLAQRGQTYLLMKRYEEALADLNQAIALDENYSWAIRIRGMTYRSMERYEEALVDFNSRLALDEKDSWALAQRGETYRLMERYEEALADFNQAIALDENYSWVIGSRGQTYQAMERYEEALADLNQAIALDEKDSWALAQRGETYRLLKRYEEALADLNQAIALDENNSWAIGSRGRTYQSMKRYEEALADFNSRLALDEKDSWALAQRGETYRLMERYEEALADFNQAIALDENNSWAIGSRGQTYQSMKRYEEALADFNQAIVLDEKLSWAIGSRGRTYRSMGRYEEALADFNSRLALDEKDSWALAQGGETYRLMKRYEEALADFNWAIALDEKDSWAIGQRGQTYRQMGRYEEALADFNRRLALDEKSAWAIGQRGETYRQMKRYEEALADFNQAIALDEKDTWAIGGRGEVYGAMKRYEEALADFNRAITLNEGLDWLFRDRGLVYLLIGRYEEALVDFNRAIALDEKYAPSKYYKALVYLIIDRQVDFESTLHNAVELVQAALKDKPDDYTLNFNLALYQLLTGSSQVEERYNQLTALCSSSLDLQEAIDDLDDFLMIRPSHELAQRVRLKLQARLVWLKELSNT